MPVFTALAAFLFSAISLVMPSGFSLEAAVSGSLASLRRRSRPARRRLEQQDYLLVAALFAFMTAMAGLRIPPLRIPQRLALGVIARHR